MEIKKKKALKKLLNKTDKELDEIINKVLEDWSDNIINTKYKTDKTLTEKVDEINKK